MKSDYNRISEPETNILKISFLIISVLSVLGSYFAYLILGIINLLENHNFSNKENCNLWYYGLVSYLLITFEFIMLLSYKLDLKQVSVQVLLINLFTKIGLSIWGSFEMFSSNQCENLTDTNLWVFSILNVSIQFTFIIILICLILVKKLKK